jgi:amino acid adenylation domain-containing protein
MSRPQTPQSKPQPFGKSEAGAIFPGHDAQPTNQFAAFLKDEVEQSIPDRFEKMVRQFPDRIAVKTEDQVVTYAELNAQANRIAHALMTARGQKAEPVALLIENGTSLTAVILGVLKAGKFFVLIDASLPASRVEIILRDSQAELVVCSSKNILLATSATPDGCSIMEIEGGGGDFSSVDIGLSVAPEGLASVAYTSGSTGEPKGVCQNQRNLLHNMMLRAQESGVSHLDRVSLLTSGTANSIHDILFPLLMGAMLLPFDVPRHGLDRLISWLIDENVSLCWMSSPLFRKLCDALKGDETFSALRLIRLRSDSVCKQDIDRFRSLFPTKCRLLTGLSSSETGIIRILEVDRAAEFRDEDVPVGYPVDGKEILLMDERGREVGADEIGEIVVRSRYLSPGYWRRPDLTADKFKPDTHSSETRLYYTGDLGLMCSDGCLIHKGRKDFRVKIRGFGVEIAEVEKALLGHPDLKEVVVVAHQNDSGETRLVGYYCSRGTAAPTVSELRTFMNERLPEYMIPAAFVKLDTLPLTPNGKVDRQALPEPGNYRPELDTPLVCPRGEIEETLAQIWSEVLKLQKVGIHDNFFDLGGHSLLATQVISRVRATFNLEIPLRTLFESPTIDELAVAVTYMREKKPV